MNEQNRFIQKFSEKTENELHVILASDKHVPEAKEAAKFIIENKSYKILSSNKDSIKPIVPKKRTEKNTTIAFELRLFFKTFGHREVLSLISSILLFISLIFIREFYSNHDFFKSINNNFFNVLIFTLIIISNHIIYKWEHGRSNSYVGRFCMDMFFVSIYLGIDFIIGRRIAFEFYSLAIFAILFSVLELFVSFVSRFIKIF